MTRLTLLCLFLLLPVSHAASRAHKNRCSDAVRVVRGGVRFVYEKEPVDSRKVEQAERHIAQMAERYKEAVQQLNSAGQWDPNDPDLAECVNLMKPMRAYINATIEKIKVAKDAAAKGGPVLEAAGPNEVKDAFYILAAVQVEPAANVFQGLKPAQAKQAVARLANAATACQQAMPGAMNATPSPLAHHFTERRIAGVVLPGDLVSKTDWLCYVAAHRDQLALRAIGNVSVMTPNYGNTDYAFKEILDKGAEWNGAASQGIFDIAANEAHFLGLMKQGLQEWYQTFGAPMPDQPFPGLQDKILAIRKAVNDAAARNPFKPLSYHSVPMESRAKAYFGKLYTKMAILSTWMDESGYTVRTNALGVPLSRYRSGQLVYRVNNDTFCRQLSFSFSEPHQGGGSYLPAAEPTLFETIHAVKCQ